MAINLICLECNSNLSKMAKICRNCEYKFRNGKSSRVIVKDSNLFEIIACLQEHEGILLKVHTVR